MQRNSDSDEDDSSSESGFPTVDFTGVNFDSPEVTTDDQILLAEASSIAFGSMDQFSETFETLHSSGKLLADGKYMQILSSQDRLVALVQQCESVAPEAQPDSQGLRLRKALLDYARQEVSSGRVEDYIQLELIGIAALNLYLQCNYTGPALERDAIAPIYPFKLSSNSILSELSVDGYWPCPVCHYPFFLLVARTLLQSLTPVVVADDGGDWTLATTIPTTKGQQKLDLKSASIWSARAAVAHQRLLQGSETSFTLWNEVDATFCHAMKQYANEPTLYLERGLAEHFFDRPGKGRQFFERARAKSGLAMEATGAVGKRTKFQTKATAQMVVKAQSATSTAVAAMVPEVDLTDGIKHQMVEHPEDGILLERVKFEDAVENEIQNLSIVDQSILLAFCLDVKNTNPSDEVLTNEEMGAYLARVLDHRDDWMVFSTALLERSWLEFSRSHARERSILQMQALADQHTNRLTITQSTRASIKESALVQDRLVNLHLIVYPPRWSMIEDLADRYAGMGIVTSAAELYSEIELWDSVVECYKRAGREGVAERIVRERLAIQETPRMWSALGDLTKDPAHYEKALEISFGRFSDAHIALGEHHFVNGDLVKACDCFEKALKIRPLIPSAWFRLGTMSMQLENWQLALRSFSEVVMQKPDEADAWANIAAVHMRNGKPSEAYPALNESLKYRRSNWRVWVSKMYTCLDLRKYDEAIQACNVLLDLREQKQVSDGVPLPEERCVKAIVGGALENIQHSQGDHAAEESAERTFTRVRSLLDRIQTADESGEELWILETVSHLQNLAGEDAQRLETLIAEYQALLAHAHWEKDNDLVRKVCSVVMRVAEVHLGNENASKDEMVKLRFMTSGIVKRVENARRGDPSCPHDLDRLRSVHAQVVKALASTSK